MSKTYELVIRVVNQENALFEVINCDRYPEYEQNTYHSNAVVNYPEGTVLQAVALDRSTRNILITEVTVIANSQMHVHEPVTNVFEENQWHKLGTEFVPPLARKLVDIVEGDLEQDGYSSLLIGGPSGYGKTEMLRAMSTVLELDTYIVNCGSMTDPDRWFGMRDVRGGDTVVTLSPFSEAIMQGNVMVILDELTRVNPIDANSLYNLLDDVHAHTFFGEYIRLGENVVFAATANIGYQFVGTFPMDAAMIRRFPLRFKVTPPPRDVSVEILGQVIILILVS